MRGIRSAAWAAAAASIALASATAAQAGVVYDTDLASPGVYYGNGNDNGHFTVTTVPGANGGTIEIGQRAIIRFLGLVTPEPGTNIYNVPTGDTTVAGKTGANWGFAFSVNLDDTGLSLANIVPTLTLHDVGTGGGGVPFNLLNLPDNGHILNGGGTAADCSVPGSGCSDADIGFQNSEALEFFIPSDFASFFLGDTFDVNANDTYIFTLDVFGNCQLAACPTPLASNTIVVNAGTGASAVPEPGTLAVFGLGLLGLAGFGTLRRRQA
jgi:hypothetical protein